MAGLTFRMPLTTAVQLKIGNGIIALGMREGVIISGLWGEQNKDELGSTPAPGVVNRALAATRWRVRYTNAPLNHHRASGVFSSA